VPKWEAEVEFIFFVALMTVLGVVGIAIGLAVGRAVGRRAARREDGGEDAFMTPIGPPPEEEPATTVAADAGDATAGAGASGKADGHG
jgi:hypothetical protein